ncbi:MAG TPA: hypothetical protein VKR31_04955 [Rhizomicrobium sp.]|nr:hypothetical protein [Rhizomicrobium sp.]
MSVADKMPISRRPFISGLLGIVAVAGIAALEAPRLFPKLFERRYPPTPFDDLFALLPDRENAARLGAALVAAMPRHIDARVVAARVRRKVGGRPLALAIGEDLAQGRLLEAQGWLLPDSLAEICMLAALVERTSVRT